tara:strand:+ start:264 stop:611 length:348 start_codon:yes stop_codon:yes gene_type:complete
MDNYLEGIVKEIKEHENKQKNSMNKKLSSEFKKDDLFFKLQEDVRKNVQDYIDGYNTIFNTKNCDHIISTYFLIFWANFNHIYGKNGEKNSTDFIKEAILKIIDGNDLPPIHKDN